VIEPEPTAARMVAAIERHRVTQCVLAPVLLTQILDLAAATAADLSSLELLSYGAAPISAAALERALRLAPCPLLQVYGLTETTGFVCALDPEVHNDAGLRSGVLAGCGRPIDDMEFALVDPVTGAVVAPGETGEIRVRSPRVMLGYWHAPAETAAAITADGWFRTGDLARQDAGGYVYLVDRLKDMIVSGGENIYPAEIEAVLAAHPAVREAAVVAAPHPRWGETPVALVVFEPGDQPGEAELLAFCRQRLAHYKCPTAIRQRDELPRNPAGKVLRRVLRQSLQEQAT